MIHVYPARLSSVRPVYAISWSPTQPLSGLSVRIGQSAHRARLLFAERRHQLRLRLAQREQNICLTFSERYYAQVELLCMAAQQGITAEREREYRRQRGWFRWHYGSARRYLKTYLVSGEKPKRRSRYDDFESLFRGKNLRVALEADDGGMIGRLLATEAILETWREAIRIDNL